MATSKSLTQLKETVSKLKAVDSEKLLRKGLGDESLERTFAPDLEKILSLTEFVVQHSPAVHDTYVNQARGTLDQIANLITDQAGRSSSEYIAQRDTFVTSIKDQLQQARLWEPFFAATAVLDRGFLEDEGIRLEYARVVDELQSQTTATISKIKEEAEKAVQGAKALAEEIETRARKTATKISVKEAQTQFDNATTELSKKLTLWAWLACVSIVVLIGLPFVFMAWPLPKPELWPSAMYHTILRVFVLSAAGAGTTFSFRILRAHLHMVEKNRHRVRVANSLESFVNSAIDPQQRDLILAKLTEAIIDFGDSGIIKGEKDDISTGAVSGELVGRILAALTPKRS
jgi:hypothetical protein